MSVELPGEACRAQLGVEPFMQIVEVAEQVVSGRVVELTLLGSPPCCSCCSL